MTEAQKETLRFYTTNDYLLINGLLWGADEALIDVFVHLINDDGRAVMAEAEAEGFDRRWNCTKEEGERLYQIYQRRFPFIDSPETKQQIVAQARTDIVNLMTLVTPLVSNMMLYRNIKSKFVAPLTEGMIWKHLGFSSCSLSPHVPENACYGQTDCVLAHITVKAGTPAIRLDEMPDVQNEPDEVILAPCDFLVTKIDRDSGYIYLTAI